MVLTAGLAACGGERRATPGPLSLRDRTRASATRLVLTAAPGWKINARVKPALETSSGYHPPVLTRPPHPIPPTSPTPPSATVPGPPGGSAGGHSGPACVRGRGAGYAGW